MKTFYEMLRDVPVPTSFKPSDYPPEQITMLIDLYNKQPIFVDRLPYTDMFNALVSELNKLTGSLWYPATVFGLLMALRKQGRLLPK